MALSLTSLRRRYAGLAESGHKQIGLRALRAAAYARKPEEAAALLARAAYHLPYAEAAR